MGTMEDGFQSLRVMGIRANNMEMTKNMSLLEQQIHTLTMSLHEERQKVKNLEIELADLKRKTGITGSAISDGEKQLMAQWIVSQKAFKELAIEFGEQLGIDSESVRDRGLEKELSVLECKNNPSHNTNADSDFLKVHAPALKKKKQSEKK